MRFPLLLLAGLTWGVGACARPGAPPGGPEDRLPPLVVGTDPDTFAVVEPGRRVVRIRFSERISERAAQGSLMDAVRISPVTGDVRVEHQRQSLQITVGGGFQEGRVYRVVVLPVVQDLFSNTMEEPFELVFSTGGEFHRNAVAGRVVDRLTGEPLPGVRVNAVSEADSLVYTAGADTAGIFAVRFLPPGRYRLAVFQDLDRDAEADFPEPQGFRSVGLNTADTVVIERMALLRPDTTPPVLASAEARDSISIELTFDDHLEPEVPLEAVGVRLTRLEEPADTAAGATEEEESAPPGEDVPPEEEEEEEVAAEDAVAVPRGPDPPAVVGVFHLWTLEERLQARVDSLARARGEPGEPTEEEPTEEPDEPEPEAEAERLPSRSAYILLASPLTPGGFYRVEVANVRNINGVGSGSGEAEFQAPELPPPPDTAGAAGDTTGTAADTAGALPDTTVVPPDTTLAPPDTTVVPPDTTLAPPDTAEVVLRALRSLGGELRPYRRGPVPGTPSRDVRRRR